MLTHKRIVAAIPERPYLMPRLKCALLVSLNLVSLAVLADQTPEQIATGLAQRALTDPIAMNLVSDLTTQVGPRLAGSEAEKRAAQWARQRFEQLGYDKAWIEEFPLQDRWVRGIETAEVISPASQPLMITALGGSVATPATGIQAEIALFKTYADFMAAPAGSVTGKIVVVTQAMVRTQDGAGYGHVRNLRSAGPGEAARRGAVAYLLRSLGTDGRRVPHTGAMTYPADAPRIPAAALTATDAEQLERLSAAGKVRIKLTLTPRQLGPGTSQNVIAEIKGREHPEQIVLLGAHLDSWDLGTGAVDDGAGVAMVMATGKLIGDLAQRPKRTIRIVLFGAEEIGIIGGEAYAKAHAAELHNYIVVAEPDFGQGPVYALQTGVGNPDEASLKRIRAALTPLGVINGDNQARGSSDVEPMFAAGVPTVTLKLDGSDYFDLHHTPEDTLDKIKPERLKQSTAAYVVFAYLAAELEGEYRAKPLRAAP